MRESVTTLARGDGSRIDEPRSAVVRDAGEWSALWAAHAGPESEVPGVDFSTRMIVAVFAGERPMPGFTIDIREVDRQDGALVVMVEEGRPAQGAMAAQILVTPFHIVSLPRHTGEVRFVTAEAAAPEAAAPVAAPRTGGSSSTGLAPNTAAALAYLAGPFSGILVLLAEKTNNFVRFHAYQAALGLGALGLLAALLLVGAFAALMVSPAGFTVMLWLAFATAIVWLLTWIACLVQAFNGRAWKLPLIGAVAERRSAL